MNIIRIIVLILLILIFTFVIPCLVGAQIYRVDKLYLEPNVTSSVTFNVPDNINVSIVEITGDWVKVVVHYSIDALFMKFEGTAEGWFPLKRITTNGK